MVGQERAQGFHYCIKLLDEKSIECFNGPGEVRSPVQNIYRRVQGIYTNVWVCVGV